MSKTTAPLLSFDARGSLGDTLVYSSWKGRSYARRYVVPANPRSAGQTLTRSVFGGLNKIWAYMPASAKAAWTIYADNSRITDRNAWLKANVSALRSATSLAPVLLSPAASGGITVPSAVFTPGVDSVAIDVDLPTLPTGWTITAQHAVAILDADPHEIETPIVRSASEADPAVPLTVTGLTEPAAYIVGIWLEYAKPNGEAAYGASIQQTITPT